MVLAVMAMLLLSASGARAAAGRKMLQEVADAPAPGPSEAGIYGYEADMVSQEGAVGMKQADDVDMAAEPIELITPETAEMAAAPAPGEHPPHSRLDCIAPP